MPKFGEVMKITPLKIDSRPLQLRETRYRGQAQEIVREFIDQNPGANAKQISRHLGYKSLGTVYTLINRMTKKGTLVQRKQDGKKRYYAGNYLVTEAKDGRSSAERSAVAKLAWAKRKARLSDTPFAEAVKAPVAKSTTSFVAELDRRAKDYVWDTIRSNPNSEGIQSAQAITKFVESVRGKEGR